MSFNAAILAVGSELLTPARIDTNSLWLTDQLNALGVEVIAKGIIGDDRPLLTDAVEHALTTAELVFVTGGLGPTEDDVTRDAVAAAVGRGLVFRQDLCDTIAERFARMKRAMVEVNRRQAYLIEGAEALPNDRGTAPGQWIECKGRYTALLPGPPGEMKAMFEQQCLPRLQRLLPPAVISTRCYRVACMPESDLDQLIAPTYTAYTNPATTILAAPGDIQVYLRARCGDAKEGESLLAEVGGKIEALLGDRIYTDCGDPLEEAVGKRLLARGETVAVAESATGGLLGERLTSVPGSSRYFLGGFLTYTDDAKTALLAVDPEVIRLHTAVSEPVAVAMAKAARERLHSTWALSITGYAGPEGGDEQNPAGTVFVGLAGPDGASARRLQFAGDRKRIRSMAVVWSLDILRRKLL